MPAKNRTSRNIRRHEACTLPGVKRAESEPLLHKLAERVQGGQHVEWPWALLKNHFEAGSEAEALKKVERWAVKNGIAVQLHTQTVKIGRTKAPIRIAVLDRQRKPPLKAPAAPRARRSSRRR
jgi:hypothetical protein